MLEQYLWADRFEALRQLNLPDNAIEKVEAMGVDTLFDRMDMEGAEYPPTDDDRKRWLETVGEEWHWSDCPNHQKTQQINDEELQFMLKWLLEFGQQKERIKSSVLLPAILWSDSGQRRNVHSLSSVGNNKRIRRTRKGNAPTN